MPQSLMDSDHVEMLRSSESTRTSIGSNGTSTRSSASQSSARSKPSVDGRSTKSGMQLERADSRSGLRNIFVAGKAKQTSSPTSRKQKSFTSFFLTEEPTRAALNAIRMESNIKSPPRTTANQLPMPPKTPPRCASPTWDPPSLFQAYPLSMKHAKLVSPNLSSSSILRMNHLEGKNNLLEGSTGTAANQKLHRRQISETIANYEWTQKIYILIISGYLLQYSGDGPSNRLPEKTLQLGRQSAAFASDAIPGRHFVIQVSQAMDADGTPASSSQSLFSRLGVTGADQRRSTSNFLLVLNNAEDMESWLSTIRRRIESLGGKKHLSETGDPKFDGQNRSREIPRQRVIVPKDPDRRIPGRTADNIPWTRNFKYRNQLAESDESQILSPWSSTDVSVAASSSSTDNQGRDSLISSSDRHSNVSSDPASSASFDGIVLDSLRDSMHRNSQLSSGQRTMMTSPGSSMPSSPIKDEFILDDVFRISAALDEMNQKQNVSTANDRHKSKQYFSDTAHATREQPSFIYPGSTVASLSPSAWDFRTSSSMNEQNPSGRTILDILSPATSPESFTESMIKFKQKCPSVPLLVRPLSPVEDFPSPTKQKRKPLTETVKNTTTPEVSPNIESTLHVAVQSPRKIASPYSKQEQEALERAEKNSTPMQSRPRPRISGFDTQPLTSKLPSIPSKQEQKDTEEVENNVTPMQSRPRHRISGRPLISFNATTPLSPLSTLPLFPSPPNPSQPFSPLSPDSKGRQPKSQRSLPNLLAGPPPGPPPAPPPACALPPLPPPKARPRSAGKMAKPARGDSKRKDRKKSGDAAAVAGADVHREGEFDR